MDTHITGPPPTDAAGSQQGGGDRDPQTLQQQLDRVWQENTELQKQLTTLKRLVGLMSDSTWKNRLNDEEYLNWIKCTMVLVETKNALCPAVEETFIQLRDDILKAANITDPSAHDHTTFEHVQCNTRSKRNFLYIQTNCKECEQAFDTLISFSKHTGNEEVKKIIKANCKGDTLLGHHWQMAKMFMPRVHRKSTEAREIDPAAMLRLLNNCKRFAIQTPGLLDDVSSVRNKLMHSSDNKVSYKDLKDYLPLMQDLLKENCWRTRPECINMVDKIQELLDDKQSLQVLDNNEEQAALEVKNQSVSDDIANKEESGEDTTELQAVKHINEQHIKEITNQQKFEAYENRHANVMEEMKKLSVENTELEKAKEALATKCEMLENRLPKTPSIERVDKDTKQNDHDESNDHSKSLDHADKVKVRERTLHSIKPNKADERALDIFGCCLLDNGSLLMADRTGTANLVSSKSYKILHRLSVEGCPTSVCSAGQGIVALGTEKHGTNLLSVAENVISLMQTLDTCECVGLAYYDGELFVSDPDCVNVYNMAGDLLRTLSGMFESPRHLVVSPDGSKLYVTDFEKGLVTVDRQGQLLSVLTDGRVNRMCGVCVDGMGRVFVIGFRSHNLWQVDETGTQFISEVAKESDKLSFPSSVCFDWLNFALVVTNLGCDDVTVFHLNK